MTITLFGISNCDTVKKARRWLETNGVEFQFHDFRKDGVNSEMITDWISRSSLSQLLNKRSTTWRQLDDSEKAAFEQALQSEAEAQSLNNRIAQRLAEQPTLLKRPIVTMTADNNIVVGFSEKAYQEKFEHETNTT